MFVCGKGLVGYGFTGLMPPITSRQQKTPVLITGVVLNFVYALKMTIPGSYNVYLMRHIIINFKPQGGANLSV